LKASGLEFNSRGEKRDAYSLRHYYATHRLLRGVNVYTLAQNMGTSVKMIEHHYGHLKPILAAQELMVERCDIEDMQTMTEIG
jgi:integrase